MKKVIEKILGEDLMISLRVLKSKISPNFLRSKSYKKAQEEMNSFYSSILEKGDLCFDVGANIGNRVEIFLKIGAKVVAVEPQNYCYKFLKKKFKNKIFIENKGLGSKEEEKDFYISNYSVLSSFSTDWIESVKSERFKDSNWNKVIKTQMTTLDKLIEKYGQPKFIKIDVEGFELEVLKGLTHPIKMISFEYTVPEQTNRALECITLLEKIDPGILCNYSIGESMEFALNDWISPKEIINRIKTSEFLNTGFGDIYIKGSK